MIDTILRPIELVVAWIMVQFHWLFSHLGMRPEGGLTWILSIVGLVIVIRVVLIPLFVKQIHASRGMQALSPELKAIQKKYKGKSDPASREAMSRETMELYRKHGTNPFASCLPMLAQAPIFFALFRVLNNGIRTGTGIGSLTTDLALQRARRHVLLGELLLRGERRDRHRDYEQRSDHLDTRQVGTQEGLRERCAEERRLLRLQGQIRGE